MNSAWDQFQSALLCLACSGSIKDRLNTAYHGWLSQVAEDELPKELRDEFRELNFAMTRERPMLRGEDAVSATIRKMSNDEADRIASSVVRIFAGLPRTAVAPARNTSAQVVPLYIAEMPELRAGTG